MYKMRVFTGDVARGLERGLNLCQITRENLAFEGKFSRLAQDPRIEIAIGSVFDNPRGFYNVKLKQNLKRREILSLTKEYGFAKPINVTGTDDMECTEHDLGIELTFPYPNQSCPSAVLPVGWKGHISPVP